MRRITTSTRWVDKFGAGKDGFRDGDLANSIPPTDLNADWFDQQQEELAAVIEAAGLTLDGDDRAQLLAAIRRGFGGFRNLAIFTASGTFNVPSWCTKAYIRGWGGGGGGGGAVSNSAGSGGQGGGYFEGIVDLTPGDAIAVTVGASGLYGDQAVPRNGGAGGSTSFGSIVTAAGGAGGVSRTSSGASAGASGGGGVTGGAGLLKATAPGTASAYQIGSQYLASGGGASPFGGGVTSPTVGGPLGHNFPGGGGCGGANGFNGNSGAAGLLLVWY